MMEAAQVKLIRITNKKSETKSFHGWSQSASPSHQADRSGK